MKKSYFATNLVCYHTMWLIFNQMVMMNNIARTIYKRSLRIYLFWNYKILYTADNTLITVVLGWKIKQGIKKRKKNEDTNDSF
jgi:hypothetical protein